MPYFLYKTQGISNIGETLPKFYDDLKLGICKRDNYYLGYAEKIESVVKIKNYFVCFLDDDTAEGFKLLGIDEVPPHPNKTKELTSKELSNLNKAKKLMLKLQLRDKIEINVGDIPDIIADLNKRIDLIERLLMKIAYYLLQNQNIPSEISDKYLPLVTQYINDIDNNIIKTRADLENTFELYNKLFKRMNKLIDLIESEYLNKLALFNNNS